MSRNRLNPTRYRDFDFNFLAHPITGDIGILEDDRAITQSIRNIVLNSLYASPYRSRKSGRVYESLFENFDPIRIQIAEDTITRAINNYEPRAIIESVNISNVEELYTRRTNRVAVPNDNELAKNIDHNKLVINIIYTPINSKRSVSVEIFTEKVR